MPILGLTSINTVKAQEPNYHFLLTPTVITLTNTTFGNQFNFNATIINRNNYTETYTYTTTALHAIVEWDWLIAEIEANGTHTTLFTVTFLEHFNQTNFEIDILDSSDNLRIIYANLSFQLQTEQLFILLIIIVIIISLVNIIFKKLERSF
jgi:hypothetical protein